MGRFQSVRNARIVAAYEERLAAVQVDADLSRQRGVGLTAVVGATSIAKKLRRQQLQQPTSAQAAQSQYFRREKLFIGLSARRHQYYYYNYYYY